MIKFLRGKIFNFVILLLLVVQIIFYIYNKKPTFDNFSQKNVTVENFSSIVLSKSGITKIGSEKLNKIDDENIYLEGNSYLENKEYKIYGKNISVKLKEEISISNEPVKVINSMGTLNAKGFKNLDYEGKIIFQGEIQFVISK